MTDPTTRCLPVPGDLAPVPTPPAGRPPALPLFEAQGAEQNSPGFSLPEVGPMPVGISMNLAVALPLDASYSAEQEGEEEEGDDGVLRRRATPSTDTQGRCFG